MREFLILLRYRWLAWWHDVHTKGPRTLNNLGLYGDREVFWGSDEVL